MSTFQAQAAAKGLMLTGAIEPGSTTRWSAIRRVRVILFNLLGNAETTEKGRVTVAPHDARQRTHR
jgi:hypothetical protein